MDPSQYERLEELFHGARALPPGERANFLDQVCGGEPELRQQADALLAAYDSGIATHFLETRVLEARAGVDPTVSELDRLLSGGDSLGSDETLGPYRLLRRLDRGGMAFVYLAVRSDAALDKPVAIKVLPPGTVSPATVRRFHAEHQILAALAHPNIAQLLDGGATLSGAPYIVMEYVEGERLDVWCNHHALAVADRLRLFLQLCEAVHFAHCHQVIHRDLKPGNVLVTQGGVAKLLDFGIAKLLDPESGGNTTELTSTSQRFMTPRFASPEQLCCEPITPATDVYSLGVVLYELLTGRSPYPPVRKVGPGGLIAAICDRPVPPMSVAVRCGEDDESWSGRSLAEVCRERRTTVRHLIRQLAGGLDAIVGRALVKRPAERYGSVEQFAGAVRQYLAEHPVPARRFTWTFLRERFLARPLITPSPSARG